MFLQRLLEQSHIMEDLGPSMYKRTPVRYEVQLNSAGKGLGFITLSSGAEGKRDRGKEMFVPTLVRSGTGAKPLLLADRGDYALGIGEKDSVARYHAAFIDLIAECAATTEEPALEAILAYLRGPADERLAVPDDYDPAATVIFSVDGRYPSNLPC